MKPILAESDYIYVVSQHIDCVKKKTRKKHDADLRWQKRYNWTPEAVFDTEAEAHIHIRKRAAEAAEAVASKLKLANKRCARVAKKFPLVVAILAIVLMSCACARPPKPHPAVETRAHEPVASAQALPPIPLPSQFVHAQPQDFLPQGVSYFEHEGNRCYTFYSHGISCVSREKAVAK